MQGTGRPSAPFRVLAVCTANQCRSPLVEFALRRRCEALDLDWSVSSCGTHADSGRPPHPYVGRLLKARDDELGGWSSRPLTADLLGAADLVLACALDNRNDIVRLSPTAASRTFLLLPLARWSTDLSGGLGSPADSVDTLRGRVARARDQLPATELEADLPDPIGRRYGFFRKVDQMVEAAADALTAGRRGL